MERLKKEEEEREAERERLYKEREEQRREVEQAIWAEERRLREKEAKKRADAAKLRKKQAAFRESAFDGEIEEVQKVVDEWVEETFGCTLIGAKVDCEDEHKTTALSEAACAGKTDVCALLLKHGAAVNKVNAQLRSPLWRACFMDHKETAELLLNAGADPRLKAESADTPAMVAPSTELKALVSEWPIEKVEELMAANEKRLEGQWVPPPPDPADMPAGQAGYFLQIAMTMFQDALDEVTKESDRTCHALASKHALSPAAVMPWPPQTVTLAPHAPPSVRGRARPGMRSGRQDLNVLLLPRLQHALLRAAAGRRTRSSAHRAARCSAVWKASGL